MIGTQERESLARALSLAGALCVILVLLQSFGEPARQLLRYERADILHGEAWRLITGHFVHLGWAHTLLNAAGVMLCCVFAPAQFSPRRAGVLAAKLAVLCIGVSLMLLAFSPRLANYVGLSGVLYGLYLLGLAPAARRGDRWAAAAMLTLVGWTLWQMVAGPSSDEEKMIGGRIVTHAHLYGLATAALWLAVETPMRSRARAMNKAG